MFFNYRLFFRHIWTSLFHGKNKGLRFGPKRLRFFIFFFLLFPGLCLITRAGFLLDHIFFGGFRKQNVANPVFILGNFRSGSTMLHRLLARDTSNFTSIKTWEIYSAPSISQRKFLRGLRIVDAFFGGRLHRLLLDWNSRQLGQVKIHTVGIYEPEEDEGLLYYVWYSLFVWFFFPDQFQHARFDMFDRFLKAPVKRRIMRFYRRCIQRHLYCRGPGLTYLSKNPSHTGKIDSLLREFPDAHIVYLYRNPEDMISSTVSWFSFAMHYFSDIPEAYPRKDVIMEMARHYYLYPVKRLEKESGERYMMINYKDLTGRLEEVVTAMYRQFGFTMTERVRSDVKKTARRSKNYASRHYHSTEQTGISRAELARYFGDISDFLTEI
jgi:omega-hydroxy-beta-dihydromenaquinone-9 sulfotransferase